VGKREEEDKAMARFGSLLGHRGSILHIPGSWEWPGYLNDGPMLPTISRDKGGAVKIIHFVQGM